MLDKYCERTGPEFWAEPANALTNLAIVIAAWFVWRLAAREQLRDSSIIAITWVIVAVGIGSFLFHTFATVVTLWLDVVPVFIFQLCYIGLYTRRVMRLSPALVSLLLLLFLAAVFAGMPYPQLINGSLIYLPALLVIILLGLHRHREGKTERGLLLIAALLFALSILLRTVDLVICDYLETGTHYLWHALNALVIYLVMRALMLDLSALQQGRLTGKP